METQTREEFVNFFAKEVLNKESWEMERSNSIPYWVENLAENLYYAGFRKIETQWPHSPPVPTATDSSSRWVTCWCAICVGRRLINNFEGLWWKKLKNSCTTNLIGDSHTTLRIYRASDVGIAIGVYAQIRKGTGFITAQESSRSFCRSRQKGIA